MGGFIPKTHFVYREDNPIEGTNYGKQLYVTKREIDQAIEDNNRFSTYVTPTTVTAGSIMTLISGRMLYGSSFFTPFVMLMSSLFYLFAHKTGKYWFRSSSLPSLRADINSCYEGYLRTAALIETTELTEEEIKRIEERGLNQVHFLEGKKRDILFKLWTEQRARFLSIQNRMISSDLCASPEQQTQYATEFQ